jgi:hypothetical protein
VILTTRFVSVNLGVILTTRFVSVILGVILTTRFSHEHFIGQIKKLCKINERFRQNVER